MNAVDWFVLYEPSLEAILRSAETNIHKTWDLQLATPLSSRSQPSVSNDGASSN